MLCARCLEDKEKEDFYHWDGNRYSYCRSCQSELSKGYKKKRKDLKIKAKNNNIQALKIDRKYKIKPTGRYRKARDFKGVLKEEYANYLLFLSETGYRETFLKTAFIEDYIIREV